jgi:hypothetical protein
MDPRRMRMDGGCVEVDWSWRAGVGYVISVRVGGLVISRTKGEVLAAGGSEALAQRAECMKTSGRVVFFK